MGRPVPRGGECALALALMLCLAASASAAPHSEAVASGKDALGGYAGNGTEVVFSGLGQNCSSGGNLKPVLCQQGLYCDIPDVNRTGLPGSNPNATVTGICRPRNRTRSPPASPPPPGSTAAAQGQPCFTTTPPKSSSWWSRACDFGLECLAIYPVPDLISSVVPPSTPNVSSRAQIARDTAQGNITGFCFSVYQSPQLNASSQPGLEGGSCSLSQAPMPVTSASNESPGRTLCEQGLSCVQPALALSAPQSGIGSGVCVNSSVLSSSLLAMGAPRASFPSPTGAHPQPSAAAGSTAPSGSLMNPPPGSSNAGSVAAKHHSAVLVILILLMSLFLG